MPPLLSDRSLLLILRIAAFLCFTGWTWAHLYWEGPYGVLFWQDNSFALAEKMGISWETFVGSGANDGLIQKGIGLIGWLYLACAILSLTVRKHSKIQMIGLLGGSLLLLLLVYAKFLKAQKQLPMLVEHGGQILIPVLLVFALHFGIRHRLTVITAVVAFLATFAGHGAYAIGMWPTPSHFFAMTSVILGTEHDLTLVILRTAGVLDFLICLGIFLPFLRIPSLIYGVAWGFLTALARPVAGMSTDLIYWGADQFIHEFVLRAPHYLIPLYLCFLWWKPRNASEFVEEISPLEIAPESKDPATA
ncbi:MAG: hypothetical protein AAF491_05825 [Verrucomicrobiota bacterium]